MSFYELAFGDLNAQSVLSDCAACRDSCAGCALAGPPVRNMLVEAVQRKIIEFTENVKRVEQDRRLGGDDARAKIAALGPVTITGVADEATRKAIGFIETTYDRVATGLISPWLLGVMKLPAATIPQIQEANQTSKYAPQAPPRPANPYSPPAQVPPPQVSTPAPAAPRLPSSTSSSSSSAGKRAEAPSSTSAAPLLLGGAAAALIFFAARRRKS